MKVRQISCYMLCCLHFWWWVAPKNPRPRCPLWLIWRQLLLSPRFESLMWSCAKRWALPIACNSWLRCWSVSKSFSTILDSVIDSTWKIFGYIDKCSLNTSPPAKVQWAAVEPWNNSAREKSYSSCFRCWFRKPNPHSTRSIESFVGCQTNLTIDPFRSRLNASAVTSLLCQIQLKQIIYIFEPTSSWMG